MGSHLEALSLVGAQIDESQSLILHRVSYADLGIAVFRRHSSGKFVELSDRTQHVEQQLNRKLREQISKLMY